MPFSLLFSPKSIFFSFYLAISKFAILIVLVQITCPLGGGGDATRPFPRNGGVEELHGDLTVGPRPKVWTRGQKWKK